MAFPADTLLHRRGPPTFRPRSRPHRAPDGATSRLRRLIPERAIGLIFRGPCSPHGNAPVTDDRGSDASPVPISARGSAYAYRVEQGAQRVRQRFNRKRFGDIHRTASGARHDAPGGRHRLRQCGFACALGQVRYRLARYWTATSLDQHQQGLGTWALA